MKNQIFLDARNKPHKKPKNAPITWRVSAYAYIRKNDSLLMVLGTETGRWELPGGGIDDHETIAEGIARECYEETGYRVRVVGDQPLNTFESFFYINGYKKYYHVLGLIYEAELIHERQNKKVINTVEKNEIQDVRWQKLRDIKKNKNKRFFTKFLNNIL